MGLSELHRNSALAPESLQCVEEGIDGSEETVGYVDLVSERAYRYKSSGASDLIEMPAEILPREAEARREMLETLSEFDDTLLEQLIEDIAPEKSLIYRDLHDGYRKHFDRLDAPEGTVGVAAADAADAQTELARYEALDTIVVRGLASANVAAMSTVAEAAAP